MLISSGGEFVSEPAQMLIARSFSPCSRSLTELVDSGLTGQPDESSALVSNGEWLLVDSLPAFDWQRSQNYNIFLSWQREEHKLLLSSRVAELLFAFEDRIKSHLPLILAQLDLFHQLENINRSYSLLRYVAFVLEAKDSKQRPSLNEVF